MYHYRDHKEAYEMLRLSGFKHVEIDRLTRFRKHYTLGEMDQIPTEHRRLEFMRWLFRTGKLTDQAL